MNAHELLGVLSARLVHRLSNYSSVIVGNLAIHDHAASTVEQREAALEAIREATRRTGELLDRFSELSRSLQLEAAPCPLPNLLTNLHEWAAAHPDWKLDADPKLSAQPNLALGGPWSWLGFCLDAIATGHDAKRGGLAANSTRPIGSMPPVHFVAGGYLTLILTCPTGAAIEWHEHREHLKDWNLTAAFELLQALGCRPDSKTLSGQVQQTRLSFPLVEI